MWPFKKKAESDQVWSEAEEKKLRDCLIRHVLGEVRFRRRAPSEIAEPLMEIYVQDEAPQSSWAAFESFLEAEVINQAAKLEAESKTWPEVTDCDRLDTAESQLLQKGIMLWQASPCCDTCTGSELPCRIDLLEQTHPKLRESLRDYTHSNLK